MRFADFSPLPYCEQQASFNFIMNEKSMLVKYVVQCLIDFLSLLTYKLLYSLYLSGF